MGKLDHSLAKVQANMRASKGAPDVTEEELKHSDHLHVKRTAVASTPPPITPPRIAQSAPSYEEVSHEPVKIVPEPRVEEPRSAQKIEPEDHPALNFFPNIKVSGREKKIAEIIQNRESFDWHPHIEVCRTQTNAFEEFKKLRTNLINLVDRRGVKTFMITSCKHAEGKTTTALALSRSIADLGGRKVCLVDGDLRRPRVKNFLGLKVEKGLDDVVLGEANLEEALIFSKEDNLAVLPTRKGRSIASELLGSERMGAIVRVLCKNYDVVIFDSPPCLSTTDPIVLGSLMDAISLTVKMNHTPRQSVEHSIALMRQSELPFIGLILTHHVVHYNTYLLQKYNYYQDYYGYYAYQDSDNSG